MNLPDVIFKQIILWDGKSNSGKQIYSKENCTMPEFLSQVKKELTLNSKNDLTVIYY